MNSNLNKFSSPEKAKISRDPIRNHDLATRRTIAPKKQIYVKH